MAENKQKIEDSVLETFSEPIQIPNDRIEQILLKKVYTDFEYANIINDTFDRRFFENESIGLITSILIGYFRKYSKMPSETILEMLLKKVVEKDEKLSIKKLMGEFTLAKDLDLSKDETFIKDNTLSFLKSKSIYLSVMDNMKDIQQRQDVSKCIQQFQKISGLSFDQDLGFDYYRDLDQHLFDVGNPASRIPTGFPQLDQVLQGGIPKRGKCLMVFMAQPFMGKSLMLSNLAVNFMAQGLFPLILTLEMSEEVYGTRIDAHIAAENINALQFNIDKVKSKIRDFEKLHKESKLLIKEYPPATVNCHNIQNYVEKVTLMGRKPDVILIDYINLLRPNRNSNNANMYERVGDVTREMRALSYKFECTVISATQTQRAGIGNTALGMEHTSESIGIPQTCEFLATLWQNEGDREANKIHVTPVKNRIGGIIGKDLEFFINYNTLRLSDFNRENVANDEDDVTQDVMHSLERL